MDFSQISIAVGALKTAKEIGQAALAFKNFNETAGAIAQINEQLLKAQDGLFAHNSQLMELQQKYFEATEELRKLKEALAQRGRYSLFEISDRVFVYRVDGSPQNRGTGAPSSPEPLHYLCQPCFDKGAKSVLRKKNEWGVISLECPTCKEEFLTNDREPLNY
ncbi:hypothetical protein [Dyella sp. C9]|uniref:hypothetical protein n=1 Tax=Dyella sp. C9 TaxID=2202154 RepID=UPI000DEF0521|nr:hypothetical protein [Dyella sp. C9]